ncbi:MAG: hypothetical protein PHT12_00510 [Patescibacteria group bacterium]|nr:hypothetical protein [Patescibacteria group bacterium]
MIQEVHLEDGSGVGAPYPRIPAELPPRGKLYEFLLDSGDRKFVTERVLPMLDALTTADEAVGNELVILAEDGSKAAEQRLIVAGNPLLGASGFFTKVRFLSLEALKATVPNNPPNEDRLRLALDDLAQNCTTNALLDALESQLREFRVGLAIQNTSNLRSLLGTTLKRPDGLAWHWSHLGTNGSWPTNCWASPLLPPLLLVCLVRALGPSRRIERYQPMIEAWADGYRPLGPDREDRTTLVVLVR